MKKILGILVAAAVLLSFVTVSSFNQAKSIAYVGFATSNVFWNKLGATDNRAFNDSLDKAKAAGIPVIAVDTGIDHPQVLSLIQTDNLKSARVAGTYIAKNMKKGKVLILGGTLGHQTGDARRDGVKLACEEKGITVIYRACDWDETKAFETTQNELAANPDITAIFACWARVPCQPRRSSRTRACGARS